MTDFFENETAMVSAAITAITGLLTGPGLQMDPAFVGSITSVVVVIFNLWVRFTVYSKKGAAVVATAAATEAVAAVSETTVGYTGQVTNEGARAVTQAVKKAMSATTPPGD